MKQVLIRSGAFVLLSLAVLASAVGVIYVKHENRKSFVELQELQGYRDDMEVHWGRLQLEQGTWATHGRIEGIARTKLDMIMPNAKSVVIIKQ